MLNKCECGIFPALVIDHDFDDAQTEYTISYRCPNCGAHTGIIVANMKDERERAEYTAIIESWWNRRSVFREKGNDTNEKP